MIRHISLAHNVLMTKVLQHWGGLRLPSEDRGLSVKCSGVVMVGCHHLLKNPWDDAVPV